jgi:hypothetical protein
MHGRALVQQKVTKERKNTNRAGRLTNALRRLRYLPFDFSSLPLFPSVRFLFDSMSSVRSRGEVDERLTPRRVSYNELPRPARDRRRSRNLSAHPSGSRAHGTSRHDSLPARPAARDGNAGAPRRSRSTRPAAFEVGSRSGSPRSRNVRPRRSRPHSPTRRLRTQRPLTPTSGLSARESAFALSAHSYRARSICTVCAQTTSAPPKVTAMADAEAARCSATTSTAATPQRIAQSA